MLRMPLSSSPASLPAGSIRRLVRLVVLLLTCAVIAPVSRSHAQVVGPRGGDLPEEHRVQVFYSLRRQSAQLPMVRRAISIDLQQAPIGVALERVARSVGLRLTYSIDILPQERTVSLQARRIAVGAALLEILDGTELDIMISPEGDAVVVR